MRKPLCEMSSLELRAFCEEGSGIKMPPPGVPWAEEYRWLVAHCTTLRLRRGYPAEAAILCTAADLAQGDYFAHCKPYFEEALHRALTDEDMVRGRELFAEEQAHTAARSAT